MDRNYHRRTRAVGLVQNQRQVSVGRFRRDSEIHLIESDLRGRQTAEKNVRGGNGNAVQREGRRFDRTARYDARSVRFLRIL